MGDGTATTSTIRRRRIIERPRLTRLLDESQGRIKLLVAPAGYGKTTLARQWLADKEAVWYTATPASADVAALAAGLRDAVTQVVPGAGEALVERLSVTGRPEEEIPTLEAMLAADLASWPRDAWLVIDDCQEVSSPADTFLEHLLTDAPLNALLLSRKRPPWASSRRLLYGELFELNRSELAMSEAEAQEVLGDADASSTHDLVRIAQGWPAVLALASASPTRPQELMATPELYRFFAEELFNQLDRRTRRELCHLALYDRRGRDLALAHLRSEDASRVKERGLASGLLTEQSRGEVDLHPLVRTFLRLKLRAEPAKSFERAVSTAVRTLLNAALWDEAFALIEEFGRNDLLPVLVEQAMDELLATGRTATLRNWLQDSRAADPRLLLATAELAFREGRFYECEALAVHAASDLQSDPNLAARANFVAGRAAHVASREPQARSYYEAAQVTATDEGLSRAAASGALIAAIELEDPKARELLQELTYPSPGDPSGEVVAADRQLHYETRFGEPVNLHRGRTALQLLGFVTDPVARTSFRNVFGYALAATAHWDEATALTEEQLRDAERCRLDFVLPYAISLQGMVASGRREYAKCSSLMHSARQQAAESSDLGALQMTTAIWMRAHIAQASFDEALGLGDIDMSTATRSLRGELLGVRGLALAATGHLARARAHATAALETSISVETVINARCALAVAALNAGEHDAGLEHAAAALERAVYTGMIESLACAYRGCPQLIVSLLGRRELHDSLALVLNRAGDGDLLSAAGVQTGMNSVLSLSPREKEVLALLGRGLSNAAIGQALFISPVTVKVHVRHIFDKLDVHSRAEAALRAAQLGRD